MIPKTKFIIFYNLPEACYWFDKAVEELKTHLGGIFKNIEFKKHKNEIIINELNLILRFESKLYYYKHGWEYCDHALFYFDGEWDFENDFQKCLKEIIFTDNKALKYQF